MSEQFNNYTQQFLAWRNSSKQWAVTINPEPNQGWLTRNLECPYRYLTVEAVTESEARALAERECAGSEYVHHISCCTRPPVDPVAEAWADANGWYGDRCKIIVPFKGGGSYQFYEFV